MDRTYLRTYISSLVTIGLLSLHVTVGLQDVCDLNLCNVEESGFYCEAGSVILIKEVMCRTGGQNCDEIAYREVTRLCSGREVCANSDLWLIHGKYCASHNEQSEKEEILSVVFVSYACISGYTDITRKTLSFKLGHESPSNGERYLISCRAMGSLWFAKLFPLCESEVVIAEYDSSALYTTFSWDDAAVEGNCSDTGIAVSDDKRYIASPGYPALITGSSVCLWTIEAPPGYNVDFSVREYLLRDDPGKLFVKIREVKKNGMGMKFDRTAQKDLTFTMSGNVEILLFTHDSKSGHRLWLEYRLVDDSSLEHLKLFPLPNRTTCGFPVMNTTTSTGVSTVNSSRNNSSHGTNHTRLNSTLTLLEGHTTERPSDAYFTPGMTYPPTRSSPNVTKTGVGSKDPPNTGITIAVVVCTIGIACCLAAIWVMRKHRHHKAPGRAVNCLISDTYTLEYDRSSRSSTPTTARGPHVNQAQLVGINHPPLDIAEIMRQSEIIRQKKTLRFSDDIEKVICDSPPVLESGDFPPIDFKKYIITDKNDTPEPGPDIENHV